MAQGCVATDTHCVSLKDPALQGTPSSQPTPVTATNNPKPAQQQDLSTSIAATAASTSPAIIDDALAIKTPSPQDLLKDATEKTTNNRLPSLTRFPRIIASNAPATNGEAGCRPAVSEPNSLSGGAPAPATNLSNSTPSGESAQASTCSTFTIRRHRIWSSPCMRVLFTVLLLVGAAAAVAAAAALAPALLSCATLAQACARSCCCCSCSSSSSSHVCDKWLGPGRRDWKSPEKAEMTDSNGQNASVPQHSISTKAIALLVGARPTAPCASGALLSPMLSIRELQAPRPGM